jgi:hypothetical protein
MPERRLLLALHVSDSAEDGPDGPGAHSVAAQVGIEELHTQS